ncbi:MAG: MFS transporter, partial [Halieaceae bacterium]|nr:MFS transporter [Halieaceae bacterium]
MLEVFGLSNTQLGDIFAVYGVVALLAYFPGGAIADRYSARALMTLSLVATALGGFYLATLPPPPMLYLLFAYWGLTSILLFWAALIKATRDWGGQHTQGLAFGVLDGGRGLVASVLATLAML